MKTNAATNINCIIRLIQYKNAIQRLKKLGFIKVFSDNLGDATGVISTLVRKDFSMFGITGNKKGGYIVDSLLEQLNRILGKEEVQKAVIAGAGKIGTALMEYQGLRNEGFEICAAFEINPQKFNSESRIPVYHIESMQEYIEKNVIRLGIIAVPTDAAQQVFDTMILAGIRGILNFAPIQLKAPPEIAVSNVNIAMELEKLWYYVKMS
jgi:redox-sensing transcriptional repressor